jgi:hypothetical protein
LFEVQSVCPTEAARSLGDTAIDRPEHPYPEAEETVGRQAKNAAKPMMSKMRRRTARRATPGMARTRRPRAAKAAQEHPQRAAKAPGQGQVEEGAPPG